MCPLSLSQTGVCETYRTERGAQRDRIPIRSGYGDSMIIGGAHVFAIRYRRGFQLHIFASWPYLGVWSANFRKRAPRKNGNARLGFYAVGNSYGIGKHSRPELDSSGDEIPISLRNVAAAARRREEKVGTACSERSESI